MADKIQEQDCSTYCVDNLNRLWRINDTLFEIYDPKTKVFKKHTLSGKIKQKNHCNKENIGTRVKLIHQDTQNRLWIGCEDSQLFMFDENTNDFLDFKEPLIKFFTKDCLVACKCFHSMTGEMSVVLYIRRDEYVSFRNYIIRAFHTYSSVSDNNKQRYLLM